MAGDSIGLYDSELLQAATPKWLFLQIGSPSERGLGLL